MGAQTTIYGDDNVHESQISPMPVPALEHGAKRQSGSRNMRSQSNPVDCTALCLPAKPLITAVKPDYKPNPPSLHLTQNIFTPSLKTSD